MAIVSMLQKWMRDNKSHFHRILYFTPITSVRLPGSQHRVLKTFHALTGVKTAGSVRIATTMWDNIEGEHAVKRAVANYQQLQSDIWKDFVKEGAQMTPYNNTEESALSILDDAFSRGTHQPFSLHNHKNIVKGSPFEANLLTDLQDRIQNIKSAIANHKSDLAQAEAEGDMLLQSVVRPMLQEAMADLARFQKELKDSSLLPPPAPSPRLAIPTPASEPRGTSHVTTHVQQSEDQVSAPPHDPQPALHGRQAVEVDITPKFSISTTPPLSSAPISQSGIVHSSVPPSDTQLHVPPTHSAAIPAAPRSVAEEVRAAPQQLAPAERAPGRFARITELMKCWGDALAYFLNCGNSASQGVMGALGARSDA
ncbi:hypothetical protein BJ165DRAFT_1409914 [Panaeolus papilionaceus]|nr:hypothetical protein BJ165DRAFT_1409914 [Panaeolus papilionaceus]